MNSLAKKLSQHTTPALSVSYKSSTGLDKLLNSLPEAVIITNAEFIVTGLNAVAESVYGFSSKEAIGTLLFDLVKFDMIGTTFNSAVKDLYNDGFWIGDIVFHHHNNHKVFLNCRCTLIKDDAGNVSDIIIVNHNISERKKQEFELAAAEHKYETVVESLLEGVVMINSNGIITTANKRAAEILGLTDNEINGKAMGSPQWRAIKADGSAFLPENYPVSLTMKTGESFNNVVMGIHKSDNKLVWISINSRAIYKAGNPRPDAIVASFVDITDIKIANEKLSESELLFRTFMKNSPTLGWIYNEDGHFVYGNPHFNEIVGYTDEQIGDHINTTNAAPEVLTMIHSRIAEILKTNEAIIAEDAVRDKHGNLRHYLSYWFLLPTINDKKMIGGHAVEITERKKARSEMEKMHERYTHAVNASSDAIWEFDAVSNTIYRSDAFSNFSGYTKDEIMPSFDWFYEKVHPEDRTELQQHVNYCLNNNLTNWDTEYRFRIGDGSFRYMLDKAFAIYENGKLNRVIGAMQDITERKELEKQLLNEQVQKQKMINQATIKAQEEERNRISGELHDNVNQLLMSAKIHVNVARNNPEGQAEILDKASDYILMAVEEIRYLTQKLNSNVINSVGLQKSINDIVQNMLLSKGIKVDFVMSNNILKKISVEQELMLYRITQEQTNNILKHSNATEATIIIKDNGNNIDLIISDNGRGFDKEKQKATGLGFINIFNRVDAYNGKVSITTSVGKGCILHIHFPIDNY